MATQKTALYDPEENPASQAQQTSTAQPQGGGLLSPTQGQGGAVNAAFSEDMTSAGRLDKMLSKDSPLMKRARTQGQQMAQKRGLLNSSMSAGAAQGAMIDRAQPFALQDSGQMFQNARQNASATNQFGLGRQQYQQQRGLNEQQFGFESQLQDSRQQWQSGENQADRDFNLERDQLQAELREAQAQNDFGRQQQINQQLATLEEEAAQAQREYQTGRDETLFGYDRKMTERQAELQASRDEALFGYDMQNTERQAELQAARDQRLSELDADSARLQQELQEAQAANDFERTEQLTERQAEIQESRDKLTFAQNMESMAEEYGLRDELAQSEAERAMKEMFAASTGNAWGVMNNNVTDLVGQASSEIQNVQMNPNISPEDKTAMIDDILSRRDTDLEFQKSLYEGLSTSLMSTGAFQGSGVFDEGAYLAANPDVAAEVEQGLLPSGLAHYQRYGIREGRNMEGA